MSVKLAFDLLHGLRPERSIVFLHGILGRGNNLGSIARRFVEAHPQWTALLVDLRGHGNSPKGTPNPSIANAADDVVALASAAPTPVCAVVGHSFGGKVALEVARLATIQSLDHVFVLDSAPGASPNATESDGALAVMNVLRNLPGDGYSSRAEFVAALVAAGLSPPVANWLGSSIETRDGRVRFALDLNEIQGLLDDYLERDLWPVVDDPPDGVSIHVIIGSRSGAFSEEDRKRAERAAVTGGGRITVDMLPAGHWVHIDDPAGLLAVLKSRA
jgi:pimeloyl-ACP methyl ester carboxylesterase